MTACMNYQALSDMQPLQLRTELVSSFQCPSCNSHIFCRERQFCSLVMLSCWLQTDLLLDTEMKSLNAKNEILFRYFSGKQRKVALISILSVSVKISKECCFCLLLLSIFFGFAWLQKVLLPNCYSSIAKPNCMQISWLLYAVKVMPCESPASYFTTTSQWESYILVCQLERLRMMMTTNCCQNSHCD